MGLSHTRPKLFLYEYCANHSLKPITRIDVCVEHVTASLKIGSKNMPPLYTSNLLLSRMQFQECTVSAKKTMMCIGLN